MKIRVYVDGASRGNPGPGACAVVIKDSKGKEVSGEGKFLGICTNNHAEFCGLDLALSKSIEIGASEVEVFSDSQLLVKQFNGEYKIKNANLRDLMIKIHSKAKKFRKLTITHIPREMNKEADKLANVTLDNSKSEIEKINFSGNGKQLELF
jgi:ribonuclease HI